jgi:hypothetical protein
VPQPEQTLKSPGKIFPGLVVLWCDPGAESQIKCSVTLLIQIRPIMSKANGQATTTASKGRSRRLGEDCRAVAVGLNGQVTRKQIEHAGGEAALVNTW